MRKELITDVTYHIFIDVLFDDYGQIEQEDL